MLIVAGYLDVDPDRRDTYLEDAAIATRLARSTPGCLDFVQAADPLVAGRIVIYERWESAEQLMAFRELPDESGVTLPDIVAADVRRYEISAEGPA